ncbi:MAG TPA: hypothetical protein VF175_10960 [Lacipirellula sp.]
MNAYIRPRTGAADREMQRVIEPLASYINATHQPMSTLTSALRTLANEVKKTNRAASVHVNAFTETCWS